METSMLVTLTQVVTGAPLQITVDGAQSSHDLHSHKRTGKIYVASSDQLAVHTKLFEVRMSDLQDFIVNVILVLN